MQKTFAQDAFLLQKAFTNQRLRGTINDERKHRMNRARSLLECQRPAMSAAITKERQDRYHYKEATPND